MNVHSSPGRLKVQINNLPEIMNDLARYFHVASPELLSNAFDELLDDLGLVRTINQSGMSVDDVTEEWIDSVNLQRLANNPVQLDRASMREMVSTSWSSDE